MGNPFSLTFGKKPTEYIIRRENSDEIKSAFMESPARCQTYLIAGVRGSGKTVLMTVLAQEISAQPDWVHVDLDAAQNLIDDLSYRLADACDSAETVLNRGFDISLTGLGIGMGSRESRDSVDRCEKYLEKIRRQRKKLLITIDEVNHNQSMKQFASQFQIWIREAYPIFLLMTGLYENIYAIQNDPQLTFLLRSPKIILGALGIAQIARQYETALDIPQETALQLAKETKGYAFAFQALGMLYYDRGSTADIKNLLRESDSYLDEYVYRKIWSGLSLREKNVIMQLSDEHPVKVRSICEAVGMTSATFSKYRERLLFKGLISAEQHGYVGLTLPRFKTVCEYYL